MTVRNLVNGFLTAKLRLMRSGELTERTFRQYDQTCGRLVDTMGADRMIEALTPSDFGELRSKLAKGRGPVSLGNEITVARMVFKFGYDEGLIDRPIRYGQSFDKPSRKTLRVERTKRGPKMFEQSELKAIRKKAGVPMKAFILLGTLLQSTFLDMFGDPVTNPMGWEVKPIEKIVADTKLGLVRSSREFGWDYPIQYVRMDAVTTDGRFLPEKVQFTDASEKEKQAFALRPGDFLFNTRNSKEIVGKVCVFPGPPGWLFNNNLMRIRFREEIEPTVIAMQFQFRRVQRELEQRKSGTTSVFAVYWKSLRTLPVLAPPLDLQHRFAAIVESVEQQKTRMRGHFAGQDVLFACLQSRAFNGEL